MSEQPGSADPNQPQGPAAGGGAGASNPLDALKGGDAPVLAGLGIVVAVLASIFGALLMSTLASDLPGDTWKQVLKMLGFGTGEIGVNRFALTAAVALFVAVFLVRGAQGRLAKLVPAVRFGALGAAAWLIVFVGLGLLVDLSHLGDDFLYALGIFVANVGILIALIAAAVYAFGEVQASKGS